MSERPKILCVGEPSENATGFLERLGDSFEIVKSDTPLDALDRLTRDKFAGVYVWGDAVRDSRQVARLVQNERILDGMPDGVALLDADNHILWANSRLRRWLRQGEVEGHNFYQAFDGPEIIGPDLCPFHSALATGEASRSTLRCGDRYFEVHAAPIREDDGFPKYLIVNVLDVTAVVLQRQKLEAIHQAGLELAALTPDEVYEMKVDDRIELLKTNILHYTKDLLNFDVVEIRLLDQKSGELMPLLTEGIEEEAAHRQLFARPHDNGVTGFVAYTGNSYLCENTTDDPLYLIGCQGAKSSLTVPLVQNDQVIGTFNVESPQPGAFTESDLQFLEIFSRDIALALNTLELLVAQQANTAQASVEAIHGEVALPVDSILNDAVNVMERYIGHEPEVVERLQRILRNARDIKTLIQQVGSKMAPSEAVPDSRDQSAWPRLRDRRVLVVDADESVLLAAHSLLERFGCVVETARGGSETVNMVRGCETGCGYDVIIADIRLPDVSGYELLLRLQQNMGSVPLILMTGFGYDPTHSIVKARQAGLKSVLYKPFRLEQLLTEVESAVQDQPESNS
ncbi:MAG: response regulator [Planctomycetaceae bacterium]|nr:response regulator [Planctomycetaceae bacterium]